MRWKRPGLVACGLVWLVVSGAPVRGQTGTPPPLGAEQRGGPEQRRIEAVRVAEAPPVIDGRLDEAAWDSARAATEFTQLTPLPGAPATERTEARILYDDRAIYVGIRLYDTRPDSLVARLARRDEEVYSDWVYVELDSDRDRRSAFVFGVNPLGVKRDALRYDDTGVDSDWNAIWEATVRADSLGWAAEFRIPLSQLRFTLPADSAAEQVWGVNVRRWIARRNETATWSPILPDAGRVVSAFGELGGLRGLRPPRGLELRPYLLARLASGPGEAEDDGFFGSGGADVQYAVTPSLALTSTLNPDFGQVEADPSVVNLTQYQISFPEKRPFFLEGADLFQLELGRAQLFYSRRIGRAPHGNAAADGDLVDVPGATTILNATKLSGRVSEGWTVGALAALTARETARLVDSGGAEREVPVEPFSSYFAARAVRDYREGQSAVGAVLTATHRSLEEGSGLAFLPSAAYVLGVDARHRFGAGRYQVSGALVGSRVSGSRQAIAELQRAPEHNFQRPDAAHLTLDPTRTSLGGASAAVSVSKIAGGHWYWGAEGFAHSPDFEVNDLGFLRHTDEAFQSVYVGYDQFRPSERLLRWDLYLNQWSSWTFGGERTSTGASLSGSVQLPSFWGGSGSIEHELGALSTGALRGGPALATPARTAVSVGVDSDYRRPFGVELSIGGSREAESGSRSFRLAPGLRLRPTPRLDLSLLPSIAWDAYGWQFVSREEVGSEPHYLFGRLDQTTASLTVRLSYAFTPDLSFQLYAQPFVSAGEYAGFKEVVSPRAERFRDRFRTFAADEIHYDPVERLYRVELGPGAEASFGDPDFNHKQLRSNAVLRWEYRPGSTLFVVWTQDRTHFDPDGSFSLGDFGRLLDGDRREVPVADVLLVKLSYWLGM